MAVKGSATVTLSQYRDTQSVTRYYKLQSSSLAAPDKPSNVKPNETPAGWSKSEPACDITKTLYTCDVTVFSDKTTHVSDVSKSTSYEAAKEAWNKANNAQGTADAAKQFTDNALNNYGYQYKAEIEVAGDSNTYYPVMIFSTIASSQDVMREILVKRSYYEKAPAEWQGHTTTHGIALTCKIKCNFGGWGGALYDWRIHELNEMYGNVFAGCEVCAQGLGFAIFLRGGGAKYTLYSDMPLSDPFRTNHTTMEAPSIWYERGMFGWSGGTAENPEYPFYTPDPRTYTDDVTKEIHDRTYIQVATDAYENADKAQNTADKAQSSADKAQNTATEAAKTADNYISTDSTGIMVSENKGTTKETPSNATKNNVLITEKDVQIRNGQKVLASYGDSIRLGEATGQHISVDNTGLTIQDRDKKQFEVRTLTSGQTFTDVWLDEGKISPGSGLDTSRVFSAAEIDSILNDTYYDAEILNLTFPSQGVPKVTLIFGGGNSGYNVPTDSSSAIYFTAADQDIEGKALKLVIDYRDNPSGVSGGFNWSDLSAIKVEYTINFTPTTVRIGDGATEDTFINDGTPVNSFKALKVGKGMSREGNWQNDNAFDVDFNGDTYVGGELTVKRDILNQGGQIYTGAINVETIVQASNVYIERPDGKEQSIADLIYPVGSIYMSVNSADPGTLIGGTWERIKDKFLLSAGDTYAAGSTGGSANAVVVKHLHQPFTGDGFNAYMSGTVERVRLGTSTASSARYAIVGKKNASSADASGLRYAGSTDYTGSDGAGKNMPPYLAVYVWQRIS